MTSDHIEKIVSTKISRADFEFLKEYAKIWYNNNWIDQPTISHMLRGMIQMVRKWSITYPGRTLTPTGPSDK